MKISKEKCAAIFFSLTIFEKDYCPKLGEKISRKYLHVEHKEAAVFTHQNLQLADNIAFLLYWVLQRGARCSNCPANV